jgi:hypothetical protein
VRALLACSVLLAALAPATAGDDGPPATAFSKVVAAWQARDAAGVVAQMGKDEKLQLKLDDVGNGRINAHTTREQAQAILKGYFERVESASLKDVTPPGARPKVRTFDYGYRPRGGQARTTRLSFTLKDVEKGSWTLSGVEERPRPR